MRMTGKGSAAIVGLALSAGVALAASGADAIKERRALMKENGEATKPIVPILKGQAPFDLAAVQKALKTYLNAAEKMPALFPPDSKTGDTHALPAIWENTADFDARFKKLGDDATAALTEVKDEASFKATMPNFYKNCGGCHEKYREKEN
ncbi:c-type cytochrome [Roseiarcus sp.]|uniref:c-type cytochrome n=1 Tax=Roseiarcus sp. TaxID=1969460 RepID=UPI003F9D4BBC